jgi:hypothetical protein
MTELQKKKEHLEALEAFMNSIAYEGYKAALNVDIETTKELIIQTPPVSFENFAKELLLRGELINLESRISMFEDARVTLERRIDEMAETEIQNATTTKK